MATVEEQKEPQHVARRKLMTAWCSPERSILDLLLTVQKHHAKPNGWRAGGLDGVHVGPRLR